MITSAAIQNVVADIFGVTRADLIGPCQCQEFVHPRQVAMFIVREMTALSLTSIGRKFGDRHHTTVIHAIAHVRHLSRSDPDFRQLAGRALMRACELEALYTTNAIEEASRTRMFHDQEIAVRYPQANAQGPLGAPAIGGTGSARADQAQGVSPADVDRENALSAPR